MLRRASRTWALFANAVPLILVLFHLLQTEAQSHSNTNQRYRGHTGATFTRADQPPPLDSDYPDSEYLHPLIDVYTLPQKNGYVPVKLHPCEQSSCYPATGNLLIGREQQLYASSTCGVHGRERYCIVSHLEERKKCFTCDSRPTDKPNPQLNHNISNIVYRWYPGSRQLTWWQSENGKENVYIQLDLEAEFHFTHLIITFKTFRPAAMLIERSYDFKQTWHVYRYFAHNCNESFPGVREGYPENMSDVVCESRYSNVAPSTDGEIIYRVLLPNLPIDNPYSQEVQNMLKMTNLRINFTKLHTLGDDLLDKRQEIQEKYYYAITDMVVRGSCSCYGHANRCLPLDGIEPKPDMVHGRCECTHNTKGRNCEKCEDFFNDLPWRPAIGKQTNACKKCNCNNHANTCHFDAALYQSSNRISGGVCDNCQHNTMGSHCELCKPFYYRDPTRDLQDPEVCKPCDCDPYGSLDNGICDSATDSANNLQAGSCHCKANVEGRRCDSCKNGYWNFTESNPDGCTACNCNLLGTINNQGCNVFTGECICKRYVFGRNCVQCLPQYWGLSEKPDGCNPCDCDPGGSLDNNCDVITGQCVCREGMAGRTCSQAKQQHYTASLEYLLYEAESARSSPNCQVVIREPYRDGSDVTWTGPGFVKVFEGSHIEFSINEIKTSMDYDIDIKYEPTSPKDWDDVGVTVIRPGPVDPNGPCAYDRDQERRVGLPSNSRRAKVYPSVCLEAGQNYTIRLTFMRSNIDSPTASVLIDAIVLVPRYEKIPWFHGTAVDEARRQTFENHHCTLFTGFPPNSPQIPEVCRQMFASIGAYVFNGAKSCGCDPTGATSKLCDSNGGFCSCKLNVVGRTCNRCAPGTYGFGPEGCKACDCNSIGALDNFCNVTTGQCKCRANTYGRECDQCRTGFWNFPNCQRCDCNGHTETCDSRTGACINCKDSTEGHNCDRCIEGYYGDPRLNIAIPCRPCRCPGSVETNHSYAKRCDLEPVTKDIICECEEGYAGSRCDVCSDNFYGNPEEPGGLCQPCDCNGNIDILKPGNCDPHTGQCKQCLYDTTGDHCEVCRDGFFRFGDDKPCEQCVCHILGTNSSAGACDPHSGQCACLPNVTGLSCDKCADNHWKIASGEGCEACNCDPQGSLHQQCNEFDGQCDCKPGFGGRQCNECMARFFGDPKVECQECKCNAWGSKSMQCDMKTGACNCLQGIGGYNCDTCARGYLGTAPECYACGECFDNWDINLQETRNLTLKLKERASDIKKVGATGAYTKEFDEMQNQLDEIEELLNNTDEINVDSLEEELDDLSSKINKTEEQNLKELDAKIASTKQTMLYTNLTLNTLKSDIDKLRNKTKQLEVNGTELQEANVQGALTLIQNAKNKALIAAHKAERTEVIINYAERQIKATETYIHDTADNFEQEMATNEKKLDDLKDKLNGLKEIMPELNNLVCDGEGDPCDAICGGAGCGSCGNSISCEDGAKQQAEAALNLANSTESALRNKESLANDFIRNVSQINTNETRHIAQETFNKANGILKKSNATLTAANDLQNEIKEFLAQNNTKPEDIEDLANKVLSKKIQLEPDEITTLANQIKEAVYHLTNIDPIIEATRDDLMNVNKLKANAENAKANATKILKEAAEINRALENSTAAQNEAQKVIKNASDNIQTVRTLLNQIGNDTQAAQNQTAATAEDIKKLGEQLDQLQRNITDNGTYANRVLNESANILEKAKETYSGFSNLQSNYTKAKNELSNNLDKVLSAKERADTLFNRALKLVAKVTRTNEEIAKLEESTQGDDLKGLETLLQDLIKRMNGYTQIIEDQVQHYKVCE